MWGSISLWFCLAFPWWSVMWYWVSFHVPTSHLCVIFREMSSHVLCPFLIGFFVFVMLCCMNSLYILDIHPFSAMLFGNIFTYSVVRLFFLLIAYFPVQNFLVWCISLFLLLIPLPKETYKNFFLTKVDAKDHTAYVFFQKFFFFFLAVPCSMQDLSSPIRDQTGAPCTGSKRS